MDDDYDNDDEYDYEDQYGDAIDEIDKLDEDSDLAENEEIDEIVDATGEESEEEPEAEEDEDELEDTDRKDELDEIEDIINRQNALKNLDQGGKTRNKQGSVKCIIIPPGECRTTNVLQPNELAMLIAHRAEQISRDGIYYIKENYIKPEKIAYMEIQQRRCPLKLRRHVSTAKNGNNYYEEFNVNEMIIPSVGSSKDLGFD